MLKKISYKKIGLTVGLSFLASLGAGWIDDLKAKEIKSLSHDAVLEKLEKAIYHQPPINQTKNSNKQYRSNQGQFQVAYVPVKGKNYKILEEAFAESQFFEAVAQVLNEVFALPSDITIVLSECGTINAFYSPEHQAVIICYELIEDFAVFSAQYATTDEELLESTLGGTMYVFIHELGHALIDVLDLPVVGKEEDAVDQLAVIIASEAGEFGELMAIVPATQYLLRGSQTDTRNVAYWDEHSLDLQRYYQIICLTYGSNPAKYKTLATLAQLPAERAQKCPAEYQKIYTNWTRLLQPHIKSGM